MKMWIEWRVVTEHEVGSKQEGLALAAHLDHTMVRVEGATVVSEDTGPMVARIDEAGHEMYEEL